MGTTQLNSSLILIERDIIGGQNVTNQAFSAYSTSVDFPNIELPIFVNYAMQKDFILAKKSGISDFNQKMVIAKYGKISAGQKVKNAMEYKVKGMLLYADPEDFARDDRFDTNVFPNSWWLPKTGIVRESVAMSSGDPETPGWPSLKRSNVHRSGNTDHSIPNIPVQPISYDGAREIVAALGGQNNWPSNWTTGE